MNRNSLFALLLPALCMAVDDSTAGAAHVDDTRKPEYVEVPTHESLLAEGHILGSEIADGNPMGHLKFKEWLAKVEAFLGFKPGVQEPSNAGEG